MVAVGKKYICVLLWCCAVLSIGSAKELIVDEAGVLPQENLSAFAADLQALSEKAEKETVVVIVQDTGDKTPEAYADDYFDEHDYGYGSEREGVLLLIVTGDGTEGSRHIHISTCGSKTIEKISGSAIDTLLDAFIGAFTAENGAADAYAAGIAAYLRALRNLITISLELHDLLIGIAAGLVVMFLSFYGIKRKYSVAKAGFAHNVHTRVDARFDSTDDKLINTHTVSRPKPKKASSSSSSGSTHESSSGKTHGGGGRSF